MKRIAHNKGLRRVKNGLTGKYTYVSKNRFEGFTTLIFTIILGGCLLFTGYYDTNLNSPIGRVEAIVLPEPTSIPQPTPILTREEQIEGYIREVFGKDGNDAIKIATCESRMKTDRIGDKHIMSINNVTGELLGDSVGLFQVRTGSHNWNRARANNMTAEQFRNKLKDYKYNVDYAKTIFDNRGWSGWYNCMNKVL